MQKIIVFLQNVFVWRKKFFKTKIILSDTLELVFAQVIIFLSFFLSSPIKFKLNENFIKLEKYLFLSLKLNQNFIKYGKISFFKYRIIKFELNEIFD